MGSSPAAQYVPNQHVEPQTLPLPAYTQFKSDLAWARFARCDPDGCGTHPEGQWRFCFFCLSVDFGHGEFASLKRRGWIKGLEAYSIELALIAHRQRKWQITTLWPRHRYKSRQTTSKWQIQIFPSFWDVCLWLLFGIGIAKHCAAHKQIVRPINLTDLHAIKITKIQLKKWLRKRLVT